MVSSLVSVVGMAIGISFADGAGDQDTRPCEPREAQLGRAGHHSGRAEEPREAREDVGRRERKGKGVSRWYGKIMKRTKNNGQGKIADERKQKGKGRTGRRKTKEKEMEAEKEKDGRW